MAQYNRGGYEDRKGYQKSSRQGGSRQGSQNNGRAPRGTANVFAPYNFIPFPVNPAYIKDERQVPGQDLMAEKTEDGEELYSGEIRYTMEAMTPVFVDDGTKEHHFCRNAAGECIIPGSTVRGLVRSNALVLGLGNVSDEVGDYSLMFRNVASGIDKKRYGDILGANPVPMKKANGDTFSLSVLKNVQAGYIEKRPDGSYVIYRTELDPADGKGYAIDPNLGRMNYYTISERFIIEQYLGSRGKYQSDPDTFPFSFLIPGIQREMMNQIAPFVMENRRGNPSYKGRNNNAYIPYYKPVAYKLSGTRYVSCLKSPDRADTDSSFAHGTLVSTGFMQRKKVIYVIPDIDHSGEKGSPRIAVELSDRDVRDFQIDYNRRVNSITLERKNPYRTDEAKVKEYKTFFNLPEAVGEKGRKPVFYIEYGGRCYFGFTPRLRLFFDHTVADGIGKNHIKGKVDYVKAIFGYTSVAGGRSGKGSDDTVFEEAGCTADARKSRVSFCDAVQIGQPAGPAGEMSPRYLTLSEPRPTDCFNYLDQSNGETSYNKNTMQLRGAKQYWLHKEAAEGKKPGEQNEKLDSLINPLDRGSCFMGTIRFRNLRKYELGLLLWSIRLEENSWMNLGKGKSYGYGAMKLTGLSAWKIDYARAYSIPDAEADTFSLFIDPYQELDIAELISSYKNHIRPENGGRDIGEMPQIQAFFMMKDSTLIPDPASTGYMTLEEFQEQTRTNTPLPIVADVVAKTHGRQAAAGSPDSGSVQRKGEKVKAVLFLAGYPLSDTQKEKLEQMSGLPAVAVKEWPNDTNVTRYAREYCAIALPSQTAPRLLETSKRFCEHVYKTIKKGKLDDGWTCLK